MTAAAKYVTFKLPDTAEQKATTTVSLPKTPHPKKLQESEKPQPSTAPPGNRPGDSAPPRKPSPLPQESERRPQSRPSSEQEAVSRQTGSLSAGNHVHSSLLEQQARMQRRPRPSDTAKVAYAVRERTNSACRDDIRLLKYNVAKLREHLLKVEEEIKQMSRGKNTLEVAVQDIRRAISTNQQSVSTQQKKSRSDTDNTLRLLREESNVLSKSKCNVEQHLRSVKTHLQTLDSSRRALQAQISSLSQALHLDAQNFRLYNSQFSSAGGRRYVSGCPTPKLRDGVGHTGDTTAPLCSRAVEVVSASKKVRGEIKNLIVSLQTQRTQVHNMITSAVAQSVEEANTKKREIFLERGQMRLSQNSTHHKQHIEEVTLGRVLGPVSGRHRSVSEKEDRPLSRLRPGSAVEERANIKKTTTKLTKQLSASALQASEIERVDQQLSRQLRHHSTAASLDSHTLRIRKMSLDNRWVQ